MKPFLFFYCLLLSTGLFCQEDYKYVDTNKEKHQVTTQKGTTFIGLIIKNNEKEIVIETEKRGAVSIPKYKVRSIKIINDKDQHKNDDNQSFGTRYFFTTNGFSLKKGEAYGKVSIIGPEYNIGLSDKFTIGVVTTWVAAPIALTLKHSKKINETNHIAFGLLAGTIGWPAVIASGENGLAALPYAVYTKGTRKSNLNVAIGYGYVSFSGIGSQGSLLGSVGGTTRISKSTSFVFESVFLGLNNGIYGGLITPGLRFQRKESEAIQVGLSILYSQDFSGSLSFLPVPLPAISWFLAL